MPGIEDYKVICDETNNSKEDINNHKLNVSILIKMAEYRLFIKHYPDKSYIVEGIRLGSRWFEIKDGILGDEIYIEAPQ